MNDVNLFFFWGGGVLVFNLSTSGEFSYKKGRRFVVYHLVLYQSIIACFMELKRKISVYKVMPFI